MQPMKKYNRNELVEILGSLPDEKLIYTGVILNILKEKEIGIEELEDLIEELEILSDIGIKKDIDNAERDLASGNVLSEEEVLRLYGIQDSI